MTKQRRIKEASTEYLHRMWQRRLRELGREGPQGKIILTERQNRFAVVKNK